MKRTALLCSALAVASCAVYDSWLLTSADAGAGTGGEGGSGQGNGGSGFEDAGAVSSEGGSAGLGGSMPSAGSAGAGEGGSESDAGTGGAGAAGGTSGGASGNAGASGGSAGASGGSAGASGGSAGTAAGASGAAGAGGSGGDACTGCAVLSVPLAMAGDRTHFMIPLAAGADFSTAVIRYRVVRKAGSGGQIRAYVQHGGTPDYDFIAQGGQSLAALDDWTEIVWDVGAVSTSFDKTNIGRIGIGILAGSAGPWTNPTVVYLDSVTVSGVATGPWNFEDPSTVSSEPAGAPPGVLWLAFGDEPVPGSLVSWLGP